MPRPPGPSMLGRRFGKLVVIEEQTGNTKYPVCMCDCGRTRQPSRHDLEVGYAKSCKFCSEHGKYLGISDNVTDYKKEYEAWVAMVARCYTSEHPSFRLYGARGILVCERWRCSFDNFYNDMGRRPSNYHSIDRIDNNGNYEPSNCRWATRAEQARNKRSNHWVTVDGVSLVITDMASRFSIGLNVVYGRLNRGWDIDSAFKTPTRKRVMA